MTQQLKVTRKFDVSGATVIGLNNALGLMGTGKVFFVDATSGNNGNQLQSQNPNYPLLTVTAANDLCTAGMGDVIVMMRNSPSTPPATETFPIAMDVSGVMLTGLYSRGLLSDSGFASDEQNVATINISTNYINIENLYLGIDSLGSTGGVIEGTASCFSFTLRNCLIESQYTATYGFTTGATFDFPYLLIEDCVFGRGDLTNFTNCVKIFNSTCGVIRNNWFTGASGYCLNILANCGTLRVTGNHFQCSSDTDGDAIMCAAGSSNNYIAGNMAAFGDDDCSNDLFADYNNDDSNDWGWNTEGDDVSYPGTS